MHAIAVPAAILAGVAAVTVPRPAACQQGAPAITGAVVPFDPARVAGAIGDRRVVLLGENGHGVSEFSTAKVRLVRYLHEHLGFTVVAFESGFHECREADAGLATRPIRDSMRRCLIYQLEHAATEPLFAYARATRGSPAPLAVAGIDLQLQGPATRTRPALLRAALRAARPRLADSVALLDSILIERSLAGSDSLRAWIREHGQALLALYDSGAVLSRGDTAWTFRTARELLRRELHRVAALAFDLEPPTDVYAIRDAWMARTIAYLVERHGPETKVVVWLHNDHARYGDWEAGPLRVRAAGQILQKLLPGEVFSVGFFMGRGTFADNSRRIQQLPAPPAGGIEHTLRQAGFGTAFLHLEPTGNTALRAWADAEQAYLRGADIHRMRPGREFDALIYIDSVTAATYVAP